MSSSPEQLELEIQNQKLSIKTAEDLEQFKIRYLGKKGSVTLLMEQLKTLPPAEKKSFGQKVNQLKQSIELICQELKTSLGSEKKFSDFDPTLPSLLPKRGSIHPIQQTIRDICSIFASLGFQTVEGPEVETEFHNFTALNISLDHPSRDSFDTFYTEDGKLLRSQTSTVQIRAMQQFKPPFKIIAPGRVYRPDTVDASHSFMFHQVEGLVVAPQATFSELKGILHVLLTRLFGFEPKLRFRPHFFPFTEPSVEVDIEWKQKGWLEILGAGSVDPNVFKAVGYDPKKWQGFAFGLGVERLAMLRHGITDIRYFYENDLRFLEQFS